MTSLPTIPPRCLQEFRAALVPNSSAGLSAEYAWFTSFALACRCGNDEWQVRGNSLDPTEFVGPLFAVCTQCTLQQRLIDRTLDGYNAEIGDNFLEESEAHDVWGCPRCQHAEGRLIASFGYQYDFDPAEPRLQDYFDCFLLAHVCMHGDQAVQVAMCDCA